jgi:Tol biopolymer transport system component
MPGLPNELHNRCRDVLLRCSEFDSDTALSSVFVTNELRPLQSGLPEAKSKRERVAQCLNFLLSKRLSSNRPALPLFLAALRDRYNLGDATRDELEKLIEPVQSALVPSGLLSANACPLDIWQMIGALVVIIALGWVVYTFFYTTPLPNPRHATEMIAVVSTATHIPTLTSTQTPTSTPAPPTPTPVKTPMDTPLPPTSISMTPTAIPIGGGVIAFEANCEGNVEIYMITIDEALRHPKCNELMKLTNNGAFNISPSWSPDGKYIAFASNLDSRRYGRTGDLDIYRKNVNSDEQTRLTNEMAEDGVPAWSPDGTRIAFNSSRDGNYEIYVMNADGSEQRNLTNNADKNDRYPAWSPDNTWIAFTSYEDNNRNGEIYKMKADGTEQNRLTFHTASDEFPAWSPDGTRIAFTSDRDGNWDIYTMNADGTELRRLTKDSADDLYPSWSPDGTYIVFSSNRDGGNWKIYLMKADGSEQTYLLESASQSDARGKPSWSRSGSY